MCPECLGREIFYMQTGESNSTAQVAKSVLDKVKGHFSFKVKKIIKIIRINISRLFLRALTEMQNNIFAHIKGAHAYWKCESNEWISDGFTVEEPAGCDPDWPLAVVTPCGMRSKVTL